MKPTGVQRNKDKTLLSAWASFARLFSALIALIVFASSAVAVDALDRQTYFDVKSDTGLEDALVDWGMRADITLMMDNTSTVGKRVAKPVSGWLTARQALSLILENSGLSYTKTGERIHIVPVGQEARKTIHSTSFVTAAEANVAVANDTSTSSEEAGHRDVSGLEEVLVTAQKRTERLQDVPVAISAVSGDELEANKLWDMASIAGYVPGLAVSNAGSPGQSGIVIRGLSTGYNNSFNAALVATYIDDEQIGSSSSGGRGGLFQLDLMPYDIERVEVLRGPQGTLYGADAMGGIVKYTLRKPDLEKFESRAGSDVDYTDGSNRPGWGVRASLNIPLISQALGLRISGYKQSTAGYIDNIGVGVRDSNSSETYGGRVTMLWQATDRLAIQVSALMQNVHSNDNTAVTIDGTTGRLLYGPRIQSTQLLQPFTQETRDYSLHIDWDLGIASLTSSSSYSKLQSALVQDLSGYASVYVPLYPNALLPLGFTDKVSKYSEELRLVSKEGNFVDWLFGGLYSKEYPVESDSWLGFSSPGVPLPAPYDILQLSEGETTSTYREWALFGDGTVKFNQLFDVGAGVRYADNAAYGCTAPQYGYFVYAPGVPGCTSRPPQKVWTWSANARLHLSKDQMIYARIATGYRPGGGCATCGNPTYDVPGIYYPDKLINYELGVKGEYFDHRLQIDGAVYLIDWRNIQLQVENSFGLFYLGNGGTAKSQGVELSASYHFPFGLRLGGTLALTDARLTEDAPGVQGLSGDPLPVTARWAGSLTTDYMHEISSNVSFIAGGSYRYKGMAYNQFKSSPNPVPMGPQNIVDLYSGAELSHTTVRLYVKNIFNNESYTGLVYLADPTRPLLVPVQPRTVGLSVDYRF